MPGFPSASPTRAQSSLAALADPANPGALTRVPVYVPAPVYQAVPPANPALPPVVVAVIEAPAAPLGTYGDAVWVQVFKAGQQAKGSEPQLRLQYANLAHNHARQKFNADRMVEEYLNIYKALAPAAALTA